MSCPSFRAEDLQRPTNHSSPGTVSGSRGGDKHSGRDHYLPDACLFQTALTESGLGIGFKHSSASEVALQQCCSISGGGSSMPLQHQQRWQQHGMVQQLAWVGCRVATRPVAAWPPGARCAGHKGTGSFERAEMVGSFALQRASHVL